MTVIAREHDGRPGPRVRALQTVLEAVVDRIPHCRSFARGPCGVRTRAAIDRLMPHVSSDERDAIMRGAARHRLVERAIFRFHSTAPGLAAVVARVVPLRASSEMETLFASSAPIVVGSAHFGPLFFALLVLRRLMRDRRTIVVVRRDARYLRDVLPFLERFGFEAAFDSPHVLRSLLLELRTQPRTAVVFTFDHTHDGRRVVPFLAAHLTACNGSGLLADVGGARVVSAIWRCHRLLPRLTLEGPYVVDRSLPPIARRHRMLDDLNELLQRLVREMPEQWSGWNFVASRIVDEPQARSCEGEVTA